MRLYSTLDSAHVVSLKEAVLEGQAPGGGLYMPSEIPQINADFLEHLSERTFQEIAFEVAKALIGDEIPAAKLEHIVNETLTFDAPLVNLGPRVYALELFHGPTFAFKDFGARFMARLISHFSEEGEEATIVVATSGDTGSAVAQGFYNVPGIRVIILYPKWKVSPLQEKQLTTLGGNITALEVDGVFDDCQKLAIDALKDETLRSELHLTSANSINIARLIPQSFYYFWAAAQTQKMNLPDPLAISVPSGNFGNLTAGLFAKRMGLPIQRFIAANNANDTFFRYLTTGLFEPKPSIQTLSNAMDVGRPNNFPRIETLYQGDLEALRNDVVGVTLTDDATKEAIQRIHQEWHYTMDPHGAVAYLGLEAYQQEHPQTTGIFLETAHPAKFGEVVEPLIGPIAIPPTLATYLEKSKQATAMGTNFMKFKTFLLDHLKAR